MASPATRGSESKVLELWERAVGFDRWRRVDALLPTEQASARGLGARNSALLGLRNALFDRHWPLRSRCSECGLECEFGVDSVTLADALNEHKSVGTANFEWTGGSVAARAPTVDDLMAISQHGDKASAIRALLARCLSGNIDFGRLTDAEVDELGGRLEQLDPGAAVSFALRCPACE